MNETVTKKMPIWVLLAFSSIHKRKHAIILVWASIIFSLYCLPLVTFFDNEIIAKRRLDKGVEIVSSPFPCLMTVHESSPKCRSRHAKRVMQYKYARTKTELNSKSTDEIIYALHEKRPYLTIPEWGVEDIEAEMEKIGLAGSPTKVKSVESIVLTSDESKVLSDSDEDVELMIKELIENHTIG